MRALRSCWWLSLVAVLAACGSSSDGNPPPSGGTLVRSDKGRATATDVPAQDVQTQATDNTAFAFDLYAQLKTTPGNLFFSPYSISSSLAMTWAGAAGSTATAMAGALHFTLPASQLHPAFDALDQALASRTDQGTSTEGGPLQLNVMNTVWAQRDLPIEAPFLDTLAESYGAGVREEDFKTDPTTARTDINAWISQETDGGIPALLQPTDITKDTRLVLSNLITFDAKWAHVFEHPTTTSWPFKTLDGSTLNIAMMHSTFVDLAYSVGDGWAAVDLPYSNPDLTLTVIVPAEGQFAAIEAQLSPEFLSQVIAAETSKVVQLDFPKFEVDARANLKDALELLGMGVAFEYGAADFSGIAKSENLYLYTVVHQAAVRIDELGTRAIAATGAVVADGAATQPDVALTVDRPFFLVLRDKPTGTVLFLGRITEPAPVEP